MRLSVSVFTGHTLNLTFPPEVAVWLPAQWAFAWAPQRMVMRTILQQKAESEEDSELHGFLPKKVTCGIRVLVIGLASLRL
jgi:hypothetical protein